MILAKYIRHLALVGITGIAFFLSSCFDVITREHHLTGPYYIVTDAGEGCKSLAYKLSSGDYFYRIQCIEKAGVAKGYIVVERAGYFQYLNINKDGPGDIGLKEIKNNISEPLTMKEFRKFLDSIQVKNVEFSYEK